MVGLVRSIFVNIPLDGGNVGFYAGVEGEVLLSGVICEEPVVKDAVVYYVVEVFRIVGSDFAVGVGGKILVKADLFPVFDFADYVEVRGVIVEPVDFERFSYVNYLAKDSIYSVMYYPEMVQDFEVVESGNLFDFRKLLFDLKKLIRLNIEMLFGEPDAGLVVGLLLGVRTTIGASILDDFQTVGLTHVLAISGYNITLIINVLGFVSVIMGRRVGFVLTSIIIFLFALLTGLSAGVVRASLMGVFVLMARLVGRRGSGVNVLLLSVFVMVLQNPKILFWDVSFQLSAVSTLGILVVLPVIEKYLERVPVFVRENLAVSFSAILFTLPLTAYYFGVFSVVALPANLVLLPLIPLIMLFSFISLVVGILGLPFAFFPVGVTHVLIWCLLKGAELFAQVPFAVVEF